MYWQPEGYGLGHIFDGGHCAEGCTVSYVAFVVASKQTHLAKPVAPDKRKVGRPL